MKLTFFTAAAFLAVGFAVVVKDPSSVGPLSPETDPQTSLEESIRRMRLSIDRELVYLARMEEMQQSMNTKGLVARQAYPADKEDDSTFGGFTDKVNDGSDVFRPIRPGVEVPSARQFEAEPSEAPILPTFAPPIDPGVGGPTMDPVTETPPSGPGPDITDMPVTPGRPGRPTRPGRPGRLPPVVQVTETPGVEIVDITAPPTIVGRPAPGGGAGRPTPGGGSGRPTPGGGSGRPAPGGGAGRPGPGDGEPGETPTEEPEDLTPGGGVPGGVVPGPTGTNGISGSEPTSSPEPTINVPGAVGVDFTPVPTGTPDFFSPEPEISLENSGDDDDDVCFPAQATVQLEDGTSKTMSQVELGDRVLVGSGQFSEVFMFTHKMASTHHRFVEIHTSSGHKLALTKGHYLYVNNKLAAASTVREGDILALANDSSATVLNVKSIMASGLYNPQTVHGDIVVNGVRASTYTLSVEPKVAHALLAPLRAVYDRVGFSLSAFEMGANYLASLVPSGSLIN